MWWNRKRMLTFCIWTHTHSQMNIHSVTGSIATRPSLDHVAYVDILIAVWSIANVLFPSSVSSWYYLLTTFDLNVFKWKMVTKLTCKKIQKKETKGEQSGRKEGRVERKKGKESDNRNGKTKRQKVETVDKRQKRRHHFNQFVTCTFDRIRFLPNLLRNKSDCRF